MKKGFTLIEMIFYVAIVALVLLVIVNMILVVAWSNREFRVSRSIQNASVTAIERISRDIQDAKNASQSTSDSLSLDIEDGQENTKTIDFVLTNGRIHVLEDSTDLGPITPDNVEITGLTFDLVTASTTQLVRTEISISSNIGSVSKSESFYTSAVLKGTY